MQISSITNSLGTLSLLNFSRKHVEKLRSSTQDELADIGQRTAVHIENLELAYSASRPLRALWGAATTAKDAADDALDNALRTLSYDLLSPGILNRDRTATAYRVLFPEGHLGFISGPDRSQLAHVQGMVAYLSANADHPMTSRAPDLAGKAAALEEHLALISQAEAQYRRAQAVESEMRATLGRALRKSVWFLRDVFDGNESDVDRLFPSIAESKVDEEPKVLV